MDVLFIWAALLALPVLAWLLFRGPGYKRHPAETPRGPGWSPTTERLVDPTSGDLIDVWYNDITGERAYVRAPQRNAPAPPRQA